MHVIMTDFWLVLRSKFCRHLPRAVNGKSVKLRLNSLTVVQALKEPQWFQLRDLELGEQLQR